MFAAALSEFGKVDAVLNVAGIAGAAPLADLTVEEFDRFISVNLTGVMLGTKHGIRTMLPTGGGAIVNWSSTGGMNGSRMPTAAYSASKAGVISLTKAAAIEYGNQGIRANTICPGFVETAMSGGKGAGERFPALVGGSALQRAGQPEEVAELASFLASDRSTLHHRCGDRHRRRQHLHAPELTTGEPRCRPPPSPTCTTTPTTSRSTPTRTRSTPGSGTRRRSTTTRSTTSGC